jgi:hypothetical protein
VELAIVAHHFGHGVEVGEIAHFESSTEKSQVERSRPNL